MEDERRSADERRAAHEALFVLLGAGLLTAGAKRRKTLSLLAILAAVAYFLWRRALTETESSRTEESFQTEPLPAEQAQVDPLQTVAPDEPLASDEVVEPESPLEEAVIEETVLADAAVEPEVTAEAEDAPIDEHSTEFEALDAALAALIGELERVEATKAEEKRLEEAQRAWREAQAEDAREHEAEAERAREEELALVGAGQLVHAGAQEGGSAGVDGGRVDEQTIEESFRHLTEDDQDAAQEEPDATEAEAAYAEAWRRDNDSGASVGEGVEDEAELEPESKSATEASADEALAPVHETAVSKTLLDEVPTPEHVVAEEPVAPERVAAASVAGGLVGMIGRYYSHRRPEEATAAEVPQAQAPRTPPAEAQPRQPVASAASKPEDESARASEQPQTSPPSDWL